MEYKVLMCSGIHLTQELETQLNVSAQQGWRLHTTAEIGGRALVIMERVKITMKDRYGDNQ